MEISAKDERIADLYASGYQAAQIAAETGVGVSTVYRKLRHPLVRARIAEARAAVLKPIRDLVVAELRKNVEVLAEIRNNPDETSRNRIAAATAILAHFNAVEPAAEDAPLRAQMEALADNPEPSNEY